MASHTLRPLALLLVLAACSKPSEPTEGRDAVLARVDERVITVGEFEDLLARKPPYVRARYASVDARKEFLYAMIKTEILAHEARRRGLDKHPDVIRAAKQVMVQKLMSERLSAIKPDDITEEELKALYESSLETYQQPPQMRLMVLAVKDAATAKRVNDLARLPEGRSNKGFRALVEAHSVDAKTKAVGGDTRYFTPSTKELPKALVEAAFATAKDGEVVGPVNVDGLYWLGKRTGHRPAVEKTFADAKRQLQNRAWRDKRMNAQQAIVDDLKKSAKIDIYDEVLEKVQVDSSGHGKGAVPKDNPGQPATP